MFPEHRDSLLYLQPRFLSPAVPADVAEPLAGRGTASPGCRLDPPSGAY